MPPDGRIPCHNCRRRRRRCDRSLPACLRCTAHGDECLGYGALLRWTGAVASRGRMAGRTGFGEAQPERVPFCLVDPLLQDLDPSSRAYMQHFAGEVCKDLVSFDQHDRNPCRLMIPLIARFDFLRDVIVSTAAIHLVARRRSLAQPVGPSLVDALAARCRAIHQLRRALVGLDDASRPAVLVAVVFFITFDLLDSESTGRWMPHFAAAGSLIRALSNTQKQKDPLVARLGDMVMADGLAFHILSSSVNAADEPTAQLYDDGRVDVPAVLRRMQAHSYHSCPPDLLHVVAQANRVPWGGGEDGEGENGEGEDGERHDAASSRLLSRALAVDARAWVDSIPDLSPSDDRENRVRLALAYRAATCLYIVLLSGNSDYADSLSADVFEHLARVPPDHELFKGAVWPTFMAGGQTDDPARRRWCLGWMRALSARAPWFCSWGYVQTAAGTLRQVWAARDALPPEKRAAWNWLRELKSSSGSYLIV